MNEKRIWWVYLSSVIECFCFSSRHSIEVLKKFKDITVEDVQKMSYEELTQLGGIHLRNKPNFYISLKKASSDWNSIKDKLLKGDREILRKSKIGLGLKGTSLALRKLGHNVAVLDVLVLKKEFNLNNKEIKLVQNNQKLYTLLEFILREKYGNLIEWDSKFWKENALNGRPVSEMDDLYLEEGR